MISLRPVFVWMLAVIASMSLPAAALAQLPVSGATLWLRADAGVESDAQGAVSAWRDQSGSANDFLQATAAKQPQLENSALALGDDNAARLPNGTTGGSTTGGNLGIDFNVTSTVQVTQLGAFDSGGDGFAQPITVQLWRRDDHGTPNTFGDDTGAEIVAQLTFTQTDGGTLEDAFRYKPLAAPVTLVPGAYTIVAYGYTGAEPYLNNYQGATNWTTSGAVQLAGTSRNSGAQGTFPTGLDGYVNRYAAGSFKFSPPGATVQHLPAISFDGVDDALQAVAAMNLTRPSTVFFVFQKIGGGGYLLQNSTGADWWLRDDGFFCGSNWVRGRGIPNMEPELDAMVMSATETRYFVNGEDHTADPSQIGGALGRAAIGGGAGERNDPVQIKVAELIAYPRALTDTERQQVQNYLNAKYALYPAQIAQPLITPPGDLNSGAVSVTITDSTPGAEIRYTLDGSDPTASSALYTVPVNVTRPARVRARGFLTGATSSIIAEQYYGTLVQYEVPVAGASVWLRADKGIEVDETGHVARWRDLTGSGNHFEIYDPAKRPALNTTDLVSGEDAAARLPNGTVGTSTSTSALGLDFNVTQAVQLTHLGAFDSSSDGFGQTITVQLWRRDDHGTPNTFTDDTGAEVVAQQTFTAADSGVLEDGFRYKLLGAPIALPPGAYTIVAYGYTGAELYLNNYQGATNWTTSPAVREVGTSRYGNQGVFPTTLESYANRYAAGSFKFGFSGATVQRQPAVSFDGLDDALVGVPALNLGRPSTVFIAFEKVGGGGYLAQNSSGADWWLRDDGFYSGSNWVRSRGLPNQEVELDAFVMAPSETRYYVNGQDFTSDPTQTSGAPGRMALGGGAGERIGALRADIAEVIAFPRVLSDAERQQVEAYLAGRYQHYQPQVAEPSITPGGDFSSGAVPVTITDSTIGAEIRYTLDGSEPTQTSALYGAPVNVSRPARMRARAFLAGYASSIIAEQFYGTAAENEVPVSGANVWLRADRGLELDADGHVARWRDQTGNGNHFEIFDPVLRPALDATALATGEDAAARVAAGTIGGNTYVGSLGLDFNIVDAVQLTQLGAFDNGSDGLSQPITVQLWRRNDRGTPADNTDDTGIDVVAQLTFTTADPGTLEDGYRFKALPSPIALPPGAYTIVAYGYTGSELYVNNYQGASNWTSSSSVRPIGNSRYGATQGVFPTTLDGYPNRYAAGNFKFGAAGATVQRLPAVSFDGSNDALLAVPSLNLGRPSTVFVIYEKQAGGGYLMQSNGGADWFLRDDGFYSGSNWVRNRGLPNKEVELDSMVMTATGTRYYVNGEDFTADGGQTSGAPGRIALGGGAGERYGPVAVKIAEVITYPRTLTDTERQQVEDYLALRYALYLPRVAIPTISPVNGRSTDPMSVTMSCTTLSATLHYTLDGSDPTETSPLYGGPISLTTSTTVKAKAFRVGYLDSYVAERRYDIGAVSVPIPLSGLQCWLRADTAVSRDAQGHVTRWGDLSGNGFDALQTEGLRQPQYIVNAFGQPAVRFDGIDDGLWGDPALNVGRPSTIFVVFQRIGTLGRLVQSGNGNNFLMGLHSTPGLYANGWVRQMTINPNVPTVAAALLNTSSSLYYVNGEDVTNDPSPTGPIGRLAFGGGVGTYNEPTNADLSEVIVYDHVLTDSDRQEVERYLADRYTVYSPKVSSPVISPSSGQYPSAVQVSISTTTTGAQLYYTLDGSEPTTSSLLYFGPFSVGATATVKAKAFRTGLSGSYTAAASYTIDPGPSPLPAADHLKAWLRADGPLTLGANGRVARLPDSSGHGNDAVQDETAAQPTLVTGAGGMNGVSVLRFPTGNEGMRVNQLLDIERPSSIFVVYRRTGTTSGNRMLQSRSANWLLGLHQSIHGYYAGDWVSPTNLTPVVNTAYLSAAIQAPSRSDYYLNGARQTVNPYPLGTIGQLVLGAGGANPGLSNVDIAEVLVYDSALSETDRLAIEDRLALKYNFVRAAATPLITPGGGSFNGPTPPISLTTATPGATIYYTIDGSTPTTSSPAYTQPFTLAATAKVKAIAVAAGFTNSTAATAQFYVSTDSNGKVLREVFPGLTSLTQLESNWQFPDQPAVTTYEPQFYYGSYSDNYATRYRAYFYPPETGNYRFDFIWDDDMEFYLSPDDDPANKVLLYAAPWSSVTTYTGPRIAAIPLEAGKRYYMEGRMVERNGGDFFGAGVTFPSGLVANPMPGRIDWNNDPADGAEYVLLSAYGNSDQPSKLPAIRVSPDGGTFSGPVNVTLTSPIGGATIRYTTDGTDPTDTTGQLYDGTPIAVATNTTLKVRGFKAGYAQSDVKESHFAIDGTTTFTRQGLNFWYRADKGIVPGTGSAVTRWEDQSGNGRHAQQSDANSQPAFIATAVGGREAVRFDGSNDSLDTQFDVSTGPRTLVLVLNYRSLTGTNGWGLTGQGLTSSSGLTYTGIRNGGKGYFGAADSEGEYNYNFAINTPYLATMVIDGQGTAHFVNGLRADRSYYTGDTETTDRFFLGRIGQSAAYEMPADIAEVMLFNRALTGPERTALEGYLSQRYGVSRTLNPPTITPGGGVFEGQVNVTFNSESPEATIRYTLDGSDPSASSTAYTGTPVTLTTTATVKAKAFAAGSTTSATSTGVFTITPDSDIPRTGLQLWLRADTGVTTTGSSVSLWADQSGLGNNATQSTASSQPQLVPNAIDAQPAIRFDGTSDFLSLAPGFRDFTRGLTAVVVTKPTGNGSWERFFDFGQAAGRYNIFLARNATSNTLTYENYGQSSSQGQLSIGQGITQNEKQILTVVQSPTGTALIYKNGVLQGSAALGLPPNVLRTSNFIGKSNWSGDALFKGDMAEILFYNRALNENERQAAEAELRGRYGISSLDAATPLISPNGGFFTAPVAVQMNSSTPDAVIYYTTDGTEPTVDAAIYSGSFTITQSTQLKAKAFKTGYNPSTTATAFFAIGDPASTGDGVAATYFANEDFTGTSVRRRDQAINFDFGTGSPVFGVGADHFAVRWTGRVQPRFTENYTFITRSDDGVRLWIDLNHNGVFEPSELLINDFTTHSEAERTTTAVPLQKGLQYDIKLEYFDFTSQADVQLLWSSFSTPREVIPTSQLFSLLPYALTVATPQAAPTGGTYSGSATVTLSTTTAGASIRYTLDGSDPTPTTGLVYTAPFAVNANATLKAIASAAGQNESGTLVTAYVIDTAGPVLSNLTFNGAALVEGATLTTSGTLRVNAVDPAGVSRVEFFIRPSGGGTDQSLGVDVSGGDGYTAYWNADAVANGTYLFTIRAYDTFNSVTSLTRTVTLNLAVPPAPVITSPAPGLVTNNSFISVSGTAALNTTVTLRLNGVDLPGPLAVSSGGTWQTTATLSSGANGFVARARNRADEGASSAAVPVTLDNSVPNPPATVQAGARDAGRIRLSWVAAGGPEILGYNLYRSSSPFNAIADAGVVKVNAALIAGQQYDDTPGTEGTWYYRLTATNVAGTTSALSAIASAANDATLPALTSVTYTPRTPAHLIGGRYGTGTVDVQVVVSEALAGVPFFSLTPSGGGFPIAVTLTQSANSATTFNGNFQITPSTTSATYQPNYSMRDVAGNRGAGTFAGSNLVVDTNGPAVDTLTLSIPSPIKNDSASPVALTVNFHLTETPVGTPTFQWKLSRLAGYQAGTPVTLTQGADNRTWSGTFTLPAQAGAPDPENLSFAFAASDDLENSGTTIAVTNQFELYQGTLPMLDAPPNFTATARAGGKIELAWGRVTEASGYQLYRSPVNGAPESVVPIQTISSGDTLTYLDQPGADGPYYYAIATLRTANGQTVTGDRSAPPFLATADSIVPPAPQALSLVLASNGILAQWQAGTGNPEPVKFRVYRSATTICSVTGLTPLLTNLTQTHVVDPSPSDATRYYAITAFDNAGNESAPSNVAYLNATLWPVSSLTIVKDAASAPVISWTNTSPTAAAYNLYNGDRPTGQKLNASPLTTISFVDASYNSGERLYSVVTLDNTQAESLPRSLLLPAVSYQLADAQTVKRGLFNQLHVTVRNLSVTNALTNALVKLTVAGRSHQSELFNLPAGQSTDVVIVVGGYSELTQATAPVALTLESRPADGELVRLTSAGTVAVADGGLAIDLVPGKFTRGGLGETQFRIQNTSPETIEIVSAKNNGRDLSPDVRFKLLDAGNNVLSGASVKVNVGTGVVNLTDGTSVIRIAPGESYLSDTYVLDVPQTTATQLTVQFEVDQLYYRYGRPEQAIVPGAIVRSAVTLADATYDGTVTSATPAASTGQQPIVIAGTAISRTDGTTLVPNAVLRVGVSANGFERTALVTTGPDGTFSYNFQPLAGESGLYSVWATHPDLIQKTAQATFIITSVSVNPGTVSFNIPRNYAQAYDLTVNTGVGTAATNLRLIPAETLPAGLTVTPAAPITLAAAQQGRVSFTFLGDSTTPATGTFRFRLVSNESPADGWALVTVNYQLTLATAAATFTPNILDTGVNPGSSASENLVIKSVGVIPLQNVQLNLSQLVGTNEVPAPTWIGLTTPSRVGQVAVGQELPVGITVQPPASLAIGDYYFYLKFTADNYHAADIPIHVAVTASGVGNIVFKVADLLTNTPDPNYVAPGTPDHPNAIYQGLYRAQIQLQSEDVPTFIKTRTTDGYGEADFLESGAMSLPAGNYTYRITADGHDGLNGRLTVRPGVSLNQTALLVNRFVSVSWEVVPITIEDHYEIVLEATFETFVPAPVVTVDPPVLNLPPLAAGDVYYGEFAITNHGLIRADNFSFNPPGSDAYNTFELLGTVPKSVDARQTIIVPYKVTCRQSFPDATGGTGAAGLNSLGSGSGESTLSGGVTASKISAPVGNSGVAAAAGGGGAGGCFGYSSCFTFCYTFVCAFGQPVTLCGTVCATHYYGGCGGGGTVTVHGGAGGGGGIIGGGGGAAIDCFPNFFDCKNRNPIGCWVNYVSRQFEDEDVDLEVRMPGSADVYARVRRFYRDNQWRFEDLEGRLIIRTDGSGPSEIVLLSSSFKPADSSRQIFTNGRDRIRRDGTHWRLDAANGAWMTYDDAGKPLFSGRNQTTLLQYLYDANGRLSGQGSPSGQQVVWYEWLGGQINAAHDAAGNRVTYEYDGGRLSIVTDALSQVTNYFYDGAGRMKRYQDPTGIYHNLGYDGAGSAVSLLDDAGSGRYFSYGYDKVRREYYFGELFTNGIKHESWYDSNGNIEMAKVNGQLLSQVLTDNRTQTTQFGDGFQIVQEYNEWGNPVKATFPDGSTHTYEYDPVTKSLTKATDRDGYIVRWKRDANGRLLELHEAVGPTAERNTTFTYNAAGQTRTASTEANDGLGTTVKTWNYRANGDLESIVDAGNHTTLYADYDANGYYTHRTDPDQALTTVMRDSAGRTRKLEDVFGRKWLYEYDAYDNLTADVGARGYRSEYEYNIDNKLVTSRDQYAHAATKSYGSDGQLLEETDRDGLTTRYEYDTLGRLARRIDPTGLVVQYTFAPADVGGYRPTDIEYPSFTRHLDYDIAHRKITATDSAAGATLRTNVYEIDGRGNIVALTDPLGRRRVFQYDGLARLTSVSYPGNFAWQFTWNRYDQITSRRSPDGKVWTYTYSPTGQMTRETSPNGAIRQFTYTPGGRLEYVIEANGDTVQYFYDTAGRRYQAQYFAGDNPGVVQRTLHFTYDDDGFLTGYSDEFSSATYIVDKRGRKVSETINYGPFSKSFSYAYSDGDRKTSLTMPDGAVYDANYDNVGHLQSIGVAGLGQISYNSYYLDFVSGMTLPGGNSLAIGHDALLRPQGLTLKNSAGSTLYSWQTTFDQLDRLGSQQLGQNAFNYDYDVFDRITQGREGIESYDLRGNRISGLIAGTSRTYDDDDVLLTAGSFTYTHNTRGDRTSRTGPGFAQSYVYDAEGRVTQVTTNGLTANYTYDPFGHRLSKTVNGVTTYYLYSDEGLIGEYDATGAELRTYGYELGTGYGERALWMRIGGVYYWYVLDHLGAPLRLIDSSGTTVWEASYDTFGAASILVENVTNHLRLPGQYFDAESSLHQNWYRYYDPMVGRYISRDPIDADNNSYAYAQNTPLVSFDGDGLRAKLSIGAGVGAYTTLDGCECGFYIGPKVSMGGVDCGASAEFDLCNSRKGPWPPRVCLDASCGPAGGICSLQFFKACRNFQSGRNSLNLLSLGCDPFKSKRGKPDNKIFKDGKWQNPFGKGGGNFWPGLNNGEGKLGGKLPPLISSDPRGPFLYPGSPPN